MTDKVNTQTNRDEWKKLRGEGYLLTGYPLCSYSNIYLPIKAGATVTMYKVWSFNHHPNSDSFGAQNDIPVIYDYPEFDIKWRHSANPFWRIYPNPLIDSLDYYDTNKLHVGRLSPQALEIIINKTRGKGVLVDSLIEYDGYVFYLPRQFRWVAEDTILSLDKSNKWKKILALTAGALTFLN